MKIEKKYVWYCAEYDLWDFMTWMPDKSMFGVRGWREYILYKIAPDNKNHSGAGLTEFIYIGEL